MRRNLKWLVLFTAVIVVTALYYAKKAHATAPAGFSSVTIAMGKFGAIDVSNYFVSPDFSADLHKGSVWLSFEKTRGKSDLIFRVIHGCQVAARDGTVILATA